jgi:hypothetical protein
MVQGDLFEGFMSYRPVWDLKKSGVKSAADLVVELLDEGRRPVTLFEIAKRRLNLSSDPVIPETLADHFTTLVDQIHDERYRIKACVEDTSSYRLVIVDGDGQPVRGHGRRQAGGFDVRESDVGRSDDAMQLTMSLGGIRAAVRRHPELRAEGTLDQLTQALTPLCQQLALPMAPDDNGTDAPESQGEAG